MSEYVSLEAKKSAVKVLTGCINAVLESKALPNEVGSLTVDYIAKFLIEYRREIEREITKACVKPKESR